MLDINHNKLLKLECIYQEELNFAVYSKKLMLLFVVLYFL